MSGGYFDYEEREIREIANKVEFLISTNDNRNGKKYSNETIDKFKFALKTLRQAEKMVRRIDYLVCDDDGEDTFNKQWEKELN